MSTMITVFMVMLCMNIVIVVAGYDVSTISDKLPLGKLFASEDVPTSLTSDAQSSIDPVNFSAVSVNTGDPGTTDFKILDALSLLKNFFGMILSLLFAPIILTVALQFPGWLTMMIAVPMTALFWISAAFLIRGVNG